MNDAGEGADELMPLARAAGELPQRRGGRPTNVSTLYRWTTEGIRGVRLDYVQVGGTRCVTRRQLAEFFARLKGPGVVAAGNEA